MLRSLALALCAVLFVACATTPKIKKQEEEPRWVSGEFMVNFASDPPQVKLCIGPCNVELELAGLIKDGTSALLYPVPEDRALRYDEIHVLPRREPGGFQHWLVYAVSRDFGNVGCTRWFLAIPAEEEDGDIHTEGNYFRVVEVQPEHEEGCEDLSPDDYKPHEFKE